MILTRLVVEENRPIGFLSMGMKKELQGFEPGVLMRRAGFEPAKLFSNGS